MSERNKPHNGRDVDGHFKVRKADVDDLVTDPEGSDFLRDDVRLGGAVEATDPFYRMRPCNLVWWPENPRTVTRPSASTPTCRRASRC